MRTSGRRPGSSASGRRNPKFDEFLIEGIAEPGMSDQANSIRQRSPRFNKRMVL